MVLSAQVFFFQSFKPYRRKRPPALWEGKTWVVVSPSDYMEIGPKTAKPRSERTCLLRVMMVGMGGNIKSLILVMCRFYIDFMIRGRLSYERSKWGLIDL